MNICRLNLLRVLVILAISAPVLAQNYTLRDLDAAFDKTTLVISASANACYVFDVYVAADSQQRARGLMFVRDLPDFTGMVFIYERPARLSMWMKNTYIPLDILFFKIDGEIFNVAKNTVPLSLESIASSGPVSYVLELNAGVTERLGIDHNSHVIITAPDSKTDNSKTDNSKTVNSKTDN